MSGFFDKVHGAPFPDVVMNSGPLPPTGGLPAPLHDTPDGRINYNSTLLGDIKPYAYGEGAYLSSQHSYLNIPHRIQKIIPVIYLPEPDGKSTFRLSHSIDDGDIAFTMRLNKGSIFCTGVKTSSRKNGLGTCIEPFINLPTLNYILAGIQLAHIGNEDRSMWNDLLFALDSTRFGKERNYEKQPLNVQDISYIIDCCITPFGIMRGSEKQGGQNEMTQSPATWPVPFVGTLVIDGKEDHIVNMWHDLNVDSGEDLVLRLKPMPIRKYTLNHYYKQPTSKIYPHVERHSVVWQLIPDKMVYEKDHDMYEHVLEHDKIPEHWLEYHIENTDMQIDQVVPVLKLSWQELGYWHIGRTQMRMNQYKTGDSGEYYHNDMVNALRSQYMMITFEPVFCTLPYQMREVDLMKQLDVSKRGGVEKVSTELKDTKTFKLDALHVSQKESTEWVVQPIISTQVVPEPMITDTTMETGNNMEIITENVPVVVKKANPRRRKIVTGSVIHTDGTSETQMLQTL